MPRDLGAAAQLLGWGEPSTTWQLGGRAPESLGELGLPDWAWSLDGAGAFG